MGAYAVIVITNYLPSAIYPCEISIAGGIWVVEGRESITLVQKSMNTCGIPVMAHHLPEVVNARGLCADRSIALGSLRFT